MGIKDVKYKWVFILSIAVITVSCLVYSLSTGSTKSYNDYVGDYDRVLDINRDYRYYSIISDILNEEKLECNITLDTLRYCNISDYLVEIESDTYWFKFKLDSDGMIRDYTYGSMAG